MYVRQRSQQRRHMSRLQAHMMRRRLNPRLMLTTIAIILLVLWLLGVIGVYTIGWFINLLLVIAVITILIRVIYGEYPFGRN